MTVTSGKDWRKPREEGMEIEFPASGNVARIKPLGLDWFINHDAIPNILNSAVFEELADKDITQLSDSNLEALKTTTAFLDSVVRATFVYPKIVDKPTSDDEISIDDVIMEDKYFLFTLLARPAQMLQSFRPKPEGNVGAIPPIQNGDNTERLPQSVGTGE